MSARHRENTASIRYANGWCRRWLVINTFGLELAQCENEPGPGNRVDCKVGPAKGGGAAVGKGATTVVVEPAPVGVRERRRQLHLQESVSGCRTPFAATANGLSLRAVGAARLRRLLYTVLLDRYTARLTTKVNNHLF